MKQKPHMLTQPLGGGTYMIVPTQGEMVDKVATLNTTGAYVWTLLEQDRSFPDLVKLVTEEYGIPPAQAEADLNELLTALAPYLTVETTETTETTP